MCFTRRGSCCRLTEWWLKYKLFAFPCTCSVGLGGSCAPQCDRAHVRDEGLISTDSGLIRFFSCFQCDQSLNLLQSGRTFSNAQIKDMLFMVKVPYGKLLKYGTLSYYLLWYSAFNSILLRTNACTSKRKPSTAYNIEYYFYKHWSGTGPTVCARVCVSC